MKIALRFWCPIMLDKSTPVTPMHGARRGLRTENAPAAPADTGSSAVGSMTGNPA